MSRIGKKVINLPQSTQVRIEGSVVHIEGPKGKQAYELPESISAHLEGDILEIKNESKSRQSKAMHGLARSLVANYIQGISEGFVKKLEIHGVGFRAQINGKELVLNLGFSHQIHYLVPDEIQIQIQDNVNITVEGRDKQKVGAVAADIRNYYRPEPYKGKGIRYSGEQILRKEGKTAQGR